MCEVQGRHLHMARLGVPFHKSHRRASRSPAPNTPPVALTCNLPVSKQAEPSTSWAPGIQPPAIDIYSHRLRIPDRYYRNGYWANRNSGWLGPVERKRQLAG